MHSAKKYHITIQIQYDEGGKLQNILKDKRWTIRKNAGATDSYTADIISRLNKIFSLSNAPPPLITYFCESIWSAPSKTV